MVESAASPHQLDSLFHALSDGTRRSILRLLARADYTVGELAQRFPTSLAAVSKHLQVLDAAHLITRRRNGRSQLIGLRAVGLRPAEQWLAYYESFWTAQLDALQTFLEAEQTPKEKPDAHNP